MAELADIPTPMTAPRAKRARSHAQSRAATQGLMNLIWLALMIWMIRDIRRRSAADIKGNRKVWYLAAFAPPIGPIVYFIFGRKRGTSPVEIPAAL